MSSAAVPLAAGDGAERAAAEYLLGAEAVRARCQRVMAAAERGDTQWFGWRQQRVDAAAAYVADVIRERFPTLDVPVHSRRRHFEAAGIDRWSALMQGTGADAQERARIGFDLVIPSVLLDAGAGAQWRYREAGSEALLARSEGLGVASLHLFASGALSDHRQAPLRSDAAALQRVQPAMLAQAFQVDASNPLVGVEGRTLLLRRLGQAAHAQPDYFGTPARIGHLFDHLAARATDHQLPAALLLHVLLRALGPLWPGRTELGGMNLGDCWRHPAATTDASDPGDGLVPFHKLTQWLAYSLLEPLADGGITVTGLDALTGLPEYRNGGLLLDLGVIAPRDPALLQQPLEAAHPAIVEWRALTVIGLDRIAERVRARLDCDAARLPLARILEGGTWTAGRKIAAELRPGGPPPLNIVSDGTVF
jgi:hypothetical protein